MTLNGSLTQSDMEQIIYQLESARKWIFPSRLPV